MVEGDRAIGVGGGAVGSNINSGDNNTFHNTYITNPVENSSKLGTKCVIALDHYFTGRVEELKRLRIALTGGGTAGVTQAIAGLGGIGKSSLARAYAREYETDYDAIFYLNASSVASLNASCREIDQQFDPPTPAKAPDELVRARIQAYLHTHDRYLLLVDNADFGSGYTAEDVKPYLPGNVRGHVLITTRSVSSLDVLEVSAGRVITLHDMEPVDAATLLWERVYDKTRKPSDAEAKTLMALAEALFYFPLALEQAAAYIAEQKITHAEYLQDQKHGLVKLLNEQKANVGYWAKDEQYRRAVETTWMHNVQALHEAGKEASVNLLMIAAYLAPEAIPLEEIADGAALGFPIIKAIFGDREPEKRRAGDYANLLKPLLDYSLVTKDADRGTFDIHRLLQEVIRHRVPTAQQPQMTTAAVMLLTYAFPRVEFTSWATCERLLPHALVVTAHAQMQKLRTDPVALLMNIIGFYFTQRGRYSDALPFYEESLTIVREVFPAKSSNIASCLDNFAELYRARGEYDKALPLYLEGLAIRREILGPEDPDVATSVNNLAELYKAQAKYDMALTLYIEALGIYRKALPSKHRFIATCLNNTAELYRMVNDYDKALPLHQEALSIRRETLVMGDPEIASSLNNVAELYVAQGKLAEALPLYHEALAIDRVSLPKNHPDLAVDLNNLAALHKELGNYEEALPLFAEALLIRREVFHPTYHGIAEILNNLATLYKAQGNYDEALPLLAEALAIMRVSLGDDHTKTKVVLNNAKVCAVEKAILDKGFTQTDISAMSRTEEIIISTEALMAFAVLLKEAESRIS